MKLHRPECPSCGAKITGAKRLKSKFNCGTCNISLGDDPVQLIKVGSLVVISTVLTIEISIYLPFILGFFLLLYLFFNKKYVVRD